MSVVDVLGKEERLVEIREGILYQKNIAGYIKYLMLPTYGHQPGSEDRTSHIEALLDGWKVNVSGLWYKYVVSGHIHTLTFDVWAAGESESVKVLYLGELDMLLESDLDELTGGMPSSWDLVEVETTPGEYTVSDGELIYQPTYRRAPK